MLRCPHIFDHIVYIHRFMGTLLRLREFISELKLDLMWWPAPLHWRMCGGIIDFPA